MSDLASDLALWIGEIILTVFGLFLWGRQRALNYRQAVTEQHVKDLDEKTHAMVLCLKETVGLLDQVVELLPGSDADPVFQPENRSGADNTGGGVFVP